MAVDVRKLAEIEAMLTDDVLTDREIVDAVRAAGLPELARVLNHALVRVADEDAARAERLSARQ